MTRSVAPEAAGDASSDVRGDARADAGTSGAAGTAALEGNGVNLVRERAVARSVQLALERLYQVERIADVESYLEAAEEGERESLLVRESEGTVELTLRVPALARREFDAASDADLDPLCQLIEGVSHFVYLTCRASVDRATTHLELETQAEVDKYVVLASSVASLDARRSATLRRRLFGETSYLHERDTEEGARYRLANAAAARFTERIERAYVELGRFAEMRGELRRFFRMGQEDKLRAAYAT
ncbi:hypothetical protein EON77_06890 [bacterium]|nr:MAG: hypothetical protein EON77_06890 [bacterium]